MLPVKQSDIARLRRLERALGRLGKKADSAALKHLLDAFDDHYRVVVTPKAKPDTDLWDGVGLPPVANAEVPAPLNAWPFPVSSRKETP